MEFDEQLGPNPVLRKLLHHVELLRNGVYGGDVAIGDCNDILGTAFCLGTARRSSNDIELEHMLKHFLLATLR